MPDNLPPPKARPHKAVRIRLPKTLHPSQPYAHGVITDVHPDGRAFVFVYPGLQMSQQTVSVAHRKGAREADGWWEAVK